MVGDNQLQRLTRRGFFKWLGRIVLGGAGTFGYMRLLEPRWVDVEQITIQIPRLPDRLAGRKVAQLSDIHLSEYTSPNRLVSALSEVRRFQPDWLMLTGDYVGEDASYAEGLIAPLRNVDIPMFGVYGNHDYWSNFRVVSNALQTTPVHMLRNEAVQLENGLWLAGLDDIWSGRPDLKPTLNAIPMDATTLLLVHEPDYFDRVLQAQAPIALQISGHSHGGQVRLPTMNPGEDGLHTYAPILPRYGRRYAIGLRQNGEKQVYTNRGLGVWPVPFRLNCRPEITIFTLEPTL